MNVLSLFAGIGGLELGLERAGMTTVGQVEIDPFCRRVLAKHWPEVPRHDDVRTAVDWWRGEPRPRVDVICGGFPCQDISNAGRREGIAGARSGLWSYMRDTVRDLRPRYVVMENVSALLVRGLDVVAADLAESGYSLTWDCVPAAAVGAPHRRDRWFGVAYADSDQHEVGPSSDGWATPAVVPANPPSDGRGQGWPGRSASRRANGPSQRAEALASIGWRTPARSQWWAAEPDVDRVAYGVPAGVDRLRALGNAVVPQVAEHIGRLIVAAEQGEVAA